MVGLRVVVATLMLAGMAMSSSAPVERCVSCHPFEEEQIAATAHRRLFEGAEAQGCEGCHAAADAAEHIAAEGKLPIFAFKGLSPRELNERCLACHQEKTAVTGFMKSEHAQGGMSCLQCHHPHLYKTKERILVAPKPVELCESCHVEVKAQFRMDEHHRVPEGSLTCMDCHEPHGSMNRNQLKGSADSICFNCHAEKRGPFLFEHAPVRADGCMSCHVPHGSANRHLLKHQEARMLCLSCHPVHPPFINQSTLRFQDCTRCHVKIHGSSFSKRFFE